MSDEPNAVQIQMDIQSAVDEAVRNIREHALRQVMVEIHELRPDTASTKAYQIGYHNACIEICHKIEGMIAKDVASDAIDGGRFAKIADANDEDTKS